MQTHYDYYICIPYRTEIKHDYAYHFKRSERSRKHRSGLDYSKIVIINKAEYLDNKDVVIDKDEYVETVLYMNRIQREASEFVEDYCQHIRGEKVLNEREVQRRYQFIPLKYFHKELRLGD